MTRFGGFFMPKRKIIMSEQNQRTDQVQDTLNIKAVEAQMLKTHESLEKFIEKSNEERKTAGEASAETKAAVDKFAEKATELGDRLAELEQAQAKHFEGGETEQTPGELLVGNEDFKAMQANGRRGYASVDFKTAIVNASPSLTQPLTAGTRLNQVVKAPDRALRIRDLLPVGRTDSNIVWFPKEDTLTNNAAVQVNTASPITIAENVALAESALTFTSDSEEVKTIGHFIPVSKQALADSSFLKSYVDTRLMYGLKLKEDTQLLTGSGTTGNIQGIYTGRTAYTSTSPITYSTKLDVLRDAKAQAHATNYEPDFVVLNPADWAAIELAKETGGLYVFSHPAGVIDQRIWGMRVVLSNSMTSGTFLVGCSPCAQIWDREMATVSISYEDSTNFQKEMATLKAVERLALTIYNSGGFIGGSFTVT
jgi:HK97 family phage major capsid protein